MRLNLLPKFAGSARIWDGRTYVVEPRFRDSVTSVCYPGFDDGAVLSKAGARTHLHLIGYLLDCIWIVVVNERIAKGIQTLPGAAWDKSPSGRTLRTTGRKIMNKDLIPFILKDCEWWWRLAMNWVRKGKRFIWDKSWLRNYGWLCSAMSRIVLFVLPEKETHDCSKFASSCGVYR